MPKVNANTIRVGNVVEINGKLFAVLKTQMVQPGKGGAFAQFELRGIRDGVKTQERYRSSEQVERVSLEDREYQYLYPEGDNYAFMDIETFEQMHLTRDFLGDATNFLIPNLKVDIEFYEGSPMGIELPPTVDLKVVETEPGLKGATVSNVTKPAKTETGLVVQVPPFINEGEKIRVSTSESAYMERA